MDISAFGKNLRRIRTELGMNQTDFAKKLNISQRQLSSLELCQVEPTVNIMFKIMRKFDVSLDELIDGIE